METKMENFDSKENKSLDCFQVIAHYGQNRSKRLFLAGKTRCDIARDFSPKCDISMSP